jgi:hypothetical protein
VNTNESRSPVNVNTTGTPVWQYDNATHMPLVGNMTALSHDTQIDTNRSMEHDNPMMAANNGSGQWDGNDTLGHYDGMSMNHTNSEHTLFICAVSLFLRYHCIGPPRIISCVHFLAGQVLVV